MRADLMVYLKLTSSRQVEYAAEYFTGDTPRPDMGSELLMFMRVLYHKF